MNALAIQKRMPPKALEPKAEAVEVEAKNDERMEQVVETIDRKTMLKQQMLSNVQNRRTEWADHISMNREFCDQYR